MEIPNIVKIGGHWVTVEHTPNLTRDIDVLGRSHGGILRIQLEQTLPDSMKGSVLLHEIIEQINYHYEIGLEHKQITLLESTLYQVLKDNNLKFGDV